METQKKKNAQSTYTTLKKCSEDPAWLEAYETIKRDTKNRLKNHLYDD